MTMKQTLKIDELNILSEEDLKEISDYFSVMYLPEEEYLRRVAMANDLYAMQYAFLSDIRAQIDAGKNVNDKEYLYELQTRYKAFLNEEDLDGDDEYYDLFIDKISESVVATTKEHIKNEFYTSKERSFEIAVNFVNSVMNYDYEQRMISAGYTQKRWETMNDSKVRKSHIEVDGVTVPVDATFKVGGYDMRFPLDTSLGASLSEVSNCRCVCSYFK